MLKLLAALAALLCAATAIAPVAYAAACLEYPCTDDNSQGDEAGSDGNAQ